MTTAPDTAKETTMIHLLLLAVRAVGPTAAHQQHRTPPATEISGGGPRHNKRRKPTSKESGMNTRLDDTTTTEDPIVRGILVVTAVITIVGVLALIRAAVGGKVDHVTVRIDNQAGLAVQVDALDASGGQVGLGEAEPKNLTTFHEILDIGPRWTLVATYGGQEVHRQTLDRTALADRNWTVTIPASATVALDRQGFQ